MAKKDNAGSRRVMGWSDFSHSLPVIFFDKERLSAFAWALKKFYNMKYTDALDTVALHLCCCTMQEFNQSFRYDLTYDQAIAKHPEIIDKYIHRLSTVTGLSKEFIRFVFECDLLDLDSKKMSVRYESKTELCFCVESPVMLKFIIEMNAKKMGAADARNTQKSQLDILLAEIEEITQDESKWIAKGRHDLYLEITRLLTHIKSGIMKERKHLPALCWSKRRIQEVFGE